MENAVIEVPPAGESLSITRFRAAIEQLAAYAKTEEMAISPYESRPLSTFKQLPESTAQQVVHALEDYCATLSQVKADHEHLRYNLNSVWLTLRKLDWRTESNFFNRLQREDIVELYTLEGLQIFRSFHFFQHTSYDLETLFSKPWFELFNRPASVLDIYNEAFKRIRSGELDGTEELDCPRHIVREKIEGHTMLTSIRPKFYSICKDRYGHRVGFAHVFQIASVEN